MAAAKYSELARTLFQRGILTVYTVDLWTLCCAHWEIMVRCYHRIAREGLIVKNNRGHSVKHPGLQIIRDHSAAVRDCLTRLGMTAVDMGKVEEIDQSKDEDAAAFFFGPRRLPDEH